MKRDMDLIRRIALEMADAPAGAAVEMDPGDDKALWVLHVIWMQEAGLVKAEVNEFMDGTSKARVLRLTWAGCEFVDAVRSEPLWAKAKQTVLKPAMSFTFDLLKDWLKSELREGFPTLREIGK